MTLIECFTSSHLDNMVACLRLRPERMILVGNEEAMHDPVRRYKKLLKQRKQNTQISLCDVTGKDLPDICAALIRLFRAEEDYVIDVTGGEELVTMAVGAVVAGMDSPQYQRTRVEKYDHKLGTVVDCIHDNKPLPGKPVEFTVEELILLNGGAVHPGAEQLPKDSALEDIDKLWHIAAGGPRAWNKAISVLSEFESRSDSKMEVYLPLGQLKNSIADFDEKEAQVRKLLSQLEDCGVIKDMSSRYALEYAYCSSLLRYCTLKAGNILEVKTLLEGQAVLDNGAPFFRNGRMSVTIDWDGVIHNPADRISETRNEIDVILMRGTTPLFISCKNGNIDEEELYKLNSVAQYFGGPYAKKMLIATELDRGTPAANRAFAQRAWDMDIFLVTDAADLSHEEWRECFLRAVEEGGGAMDKKELTLKELMDIAKKQQANQQKKEQEPIEKVFDDFFEEFADFDDYGDSDDNDDVLKEEALEDRLARMMRELERFHFSAEDQKTLREFFTLHLQSNKKFGRRSEQRRARYNLLIHSEEPETVRSFAEILRMMLDFRQSDALLTTEKELLRQAEESRQGSRRLPPSLNIPRSTRFILVDQCQDAPRLNVDGGGAARDASTREMENYQAVWGTILDHARKIPGVVLLVAGDKGVYRSTLRPFAALSQRICSHHICVPARTEQELLEDCLNQLGDSSFELAEDFKPALEKYFRSIYAVSDLRGGEFVTDLIDQIYAGFFIRQREEHVLDASCIPVYDPMAQSVEQVLGRLDQMVGLERVKEEFGNIYRLQMAGLTNAENSRYHMIFSGNPGTGKTTVARMAADLFFRMGVIKTNKLVVVKPADLVSEWIGGTGTKAMEVIRRAYNGVLFVDEAYGIANMDRGPELLNILLQEMENNGHRLIVILAGYTEEMRQLLKANPGLASRISQEITFDDYTQEELVQIFLHMCKADGFTLDPSARDELEDCIGALMTREFFGNAREIRNMLQDLKEVWSQDYYEAVTAHGTEVSLERVFLPRHFEKILPPKKEVSINDLIGLDVMKKKLAVFKRQAMYQKHLREKGFVNLSDFSMHMIFTGNPGTGKTSVAKLIADDLYSIGMLKTNRLVVAERKDLVGIHGDTGAKTADVIRKAVGGVLFIDEAYSLAGNRYANQECVEVLLTAMEEHKKDTVFIFAGYVDEMQEFLMSNPGIQSRIGYTFHFEDYSADELTRMYAEKMKKLGFAVSGGALQRVKAIMEYFQDVKNFGNGRFVNHVIHQTISQRANRDFTKQYRDIQTRDIPSFQTLIETAPNGMHLYDPAKISAQEHRRTAIHELGHAAVMVGTDPENVPKSISIRNFAGSYGRVELANGLQERTEQQLFHHIATLLGGKNAEKCILGTHSVGCAQDYGRAKRMAEDMVERFAMDTYGEKPEQILKAADTLSMKIIAESKQQLEAFAETLLSKKEITGEAFLQMLKAEQSN